MSNKVKGVLVGVLCSLAPAILWVLLAVYAQMFIGWIGALIGILFILPYKKLCPEDKTKFPYIIGAIIILVEIIAAEFISIAIIAGQEGIDIGLVLAYEEIQQAMLLDIFLGLLLSYLAFFFYVYYANKKSRQSVARQKTDTSYGAGASTRPSDTNYFVPNETPVDAFTPDSAPFGDAPNDSPFDSEDKAE